LCRIPGLESDYFHESDKVRPSLEEILHRLRTSNNAPAVIKQRVAHVKGRYRQYYLVPTREVDACGDAGSGSLLPKSAANAARAAMGAAVFDAWHHDMQPLEKVMKSSTPLCDVRLAAQARILVDIEPSQDDLSDVQWESPPPLGAVQAGSFSQGHTWSCVRVTSMDYGVELYYNLYLVQELIRTWVGKHRLLSTKPPPIRPGVVPAARLRPVWLPPQQCPSRGLITLA
jgi:hypothetical protein